ncbi:MAG: phosphoglycerate kinase [Candidatus Paceibacterota bacterium]|jgi:phosphoglycerate kinase
MHNNLPQIGSIPSLEGKRALVVAGMDVPITDGEVTEDFRLNRIKPTIEYLKENKVKIILVGHIGHDGEESTEPIARYFGFLYVDSLDPKIVNEKVDALLPGEGVVLKNIRTDPREEQNDPIFAKELASCADFFVNESFPDAHRSYASVVGVTEYLPSYAGLEFAEEVVQLSGAFEPTHPFLCIFGGAKADTKIPLVHQFAGKADTVFVGGSLANTLFRVKGYETGLSLVDGDLKEAKKILGYKNVLLPADVVVDRDGQSLTKNPDLVQTNENMLDVGLDTIQMLGKEIAKARFVLWNGPLGVYEKGYKEGTESMAKILAESKAGTIVGGGDTIASIKKLGLLDKFTFVSIGGGAMIDFLAKGTLPAIEALKNSKQS